MKLVRNLAFMGGGVLGTAYVGAFKALQEARLAGRDGDFVLGNIERVAGTSAGSIFGALVSLGHDAREIEKIMASMKFWEFAPLDQMLANLINGNRGLVDGQAFLAWMEKQVKDVLGTAVTFGDLKTKSKTDPRFKNLHVFAMHVESKTITEFSAETTPDVPIAQAVRASMSIPFFFEPWAFGGDLAKKYPGTYIDGGVAFNFPVSAFDTFSDPQNTLGFYMSNASYNEQMVAQIVLHMIEQVVGLDESAKLVIERVFDLIRELVDNTPDVDSGTAQDFANALVSSETVQSLGGLADFASRNGQWIGDVVAALVSAYTDIRDGKDAGAILSDALARVAEVNDTLSYLKVYGGAIHGLLSRLDIMGATLNTPTNMVYARDAKRSIQINTLGYSYLDLWIPDCNKRRLVNAGYNCTRQSLNLIMYS